MNPGSRRDYGEHWYVYAGDWLGTHGKSWGVLSLIVVLIVLAFLWLIIQYGGPYVEAKIAESKANAAAVMLVAESTKRMVDWQEDFGKQVSQSHAVQIDALREILEDKRKNAPCPLPTSSGSTN